MSYNVYFATLIQLQKTITNTSIAGELDAVLRLFLFAHGYTYTYTYTYI